VTTTALMRDGSNVTIRAATARDEPALRSLLANLSPESQRLRFFTGAADIDCAAHLAAAVGAGHYGLMAHDQAGVPVAHAIYVRIDQTRAEVAVEVADHLHGQGLATQLVQRLAARAETHGITSFVAEVLPENHAMLDVFHDGFDARSSFHEGTDRIEFPTAAWRLAAGRFAPDQPAIGTDSLAE
jgi:acetate---CoA ligase (ADP-forming)